MLIHLKCLNPDCYFNYEVTEKELIDNPQYHKNCLICGSKLDFTEESIEEIVKNNIYERAENYVKQWVSEIGWDNVLDLISRNKNQSCYKIYKEILEKRGFKLK